MITNKEEIQEWLNKMGLFSATINDDLTVDVDRAVHLNDKKLKVIPVKFGYVAGSFHCYNNQLTSLINSPKYVAGDFVCSNNKLTSLEGITPHINHVLDCSHNKLTSLKGVNNIGEHLYLVGNDITKLKKIDCEVKGKIYFEYGAEDQIEMSYQEFKEWLEKQQFTQALEKKLKKQIIQPNRKI